MNQFVVGQVANFVENFPFLHTSFSVMERYEIHLKRYDLSDDFNAQMFVKQLEVRLESFGMDRNGMLDMMKKTLDKMEKEAEEQSW